MKIKSIFTIALLFTISIVFSQEKKSNIAFNFIENESIGEVNTNQEEFIKSISQVVEYFNSELKNVSNTQKIGLFFNVHVTGNPTFQLYGDPKLEKSLEDKILNDLKKIKIVNTKFIDFPFFITLNGSGKGYTEDFKDFVDPISIRINEYKAASLQEKLRLNKEYATKFLPIFAAVQLSVEDKFQGVKNFGKALNATKFNENTDIYKLTSLNSDYWRGTMEMSNGNLLFPVSKVLTFFSKGELDYASKYLEIFEIFAKQDDAVYANFIEELKGRVDLFTEQLNAEIEKGIALHDKGEYQKAVDLYAEILKIYPNSSWCLYEKYFSENAKLIAEKKIDLNDRVLWDKAKVEIYKHNPLYNMDVRASTPKEGYLFFRRMEISELFKKDNDFLNDLFKLGEISTDLGVYDYAAQLFWITLSYDKDSQEKSLNNYLYCLDKLGVKDLKSNFNLNFEKIFKEIEKNKEQEMKNNTLYKSMSK